MGVSRTGGNRVGIYGGKAVGAARTLTAAWRSPPRAGVSGQVLVCALYRVGGIRWVEVGSVMSGGDTSTPMARPVSGRAIVHSRFPLQ